jgi:hypothetical protein
MGRLEATYTPSKQELGLATDLASIGRRVQADGLRAWAFDKGFYPLDTDFRWSGSRVTGDDDGAC